MNRSHPLLMAFRIASQWLDASKRVMGSHDDVVVDTNETMAYLASQDDAESRTVFEALRTAYPVND